MPRKVRENMREPPFAGRLSDYQRMTMLRREYSRRYGMSATVHRLLITIGSFFGGLGGGWTLAEVQPLGIPPEVGAVCTLIAAIAILAANAWRANWPAQT